jgi:hypothetical protein
MSHFILTPLSLNKKALFIIGQSSSSHFFTGLKSSLINPFFTLIHSILILKFTINKISFIDNTLIFYFKSSKTRGLTIIKLSLIVNILALILSLCQHSLYPFSIKNLLFSISLHKPTFPMRFA